MRLRIRQRLGMFIGGANPRGLRGLIDQIVTDLLAAATNRPSRVRCSIAQDGTTTIEFFGTVGLNLKPGDFVDETARADDRLYTLVIVSALSDLLQVAYRDAGIGWTGSFAVGTAVAVEPESATPTVSSLRLQYHLDPAIIPPAMRPAFLQLCGRAREWAVFNPGVTFTIEDADGNRRDYCHPNGLLSLAEEVEHGCFGDSWASTWRCAHTQDGIEAELVIVDRPGGGPPIVHSFCNGMRTAGGGSHVDALFQSVAAVVAGIPWLADAAWRSGPLDGFTLFLSVKVNDPAYGSATKDRLEECGVAAVVTRMVESQLRAEMARTNPLWFEDLAR